MFLRTFAETPWAVPAGRVLIASLFLYSGLNKLQHFDETVGYIGALTDPSLALVLTVLAIVFELVGGTMLLLNWNAALGLDMLALFLIIATILGHTDFSDPEKTVLSIRHIFLNLALLGGMIVLATRLPAPSLSLRT